MLNSVSPSKQKSLKVGPRCLPDTDCLDTHGNVQITGKVLKVISRKLLLQCDTATWLEGTINLHLSPCFTSNRTLVIVATILNEW